MPECVCACFFHVSSTALTVRLNNACARAFRTSDNLACLGPKSPRLASRLRRCLQLFRHGVKLIARRAQILVPFFSPSTTLFRSYFLFDHRHDKGEGPVRVRRWRSASLHLGVEAGTKARGRLPKVTTGASEGEAIPWLVLVLWDLISTRPRLLRFGC